MSQIKLVTFISLLLAFTSCSEDEETTAQPVPLTGNALDEDFGVFGQSCGTNATDYDPDINQRLASLWPSCIVDSDKTSNWVLVDPNGQTPAASARTEAFDDIRAKLDYTQSNPPSEQDFIEARMTYLIPEGLQSRVSRRPDYHWVEFPLPDLEACKRKPIDPAYEQTCVGPRRIEPLINEAFAVGQAQTGKTSAQIRQAAAQLEASFLWFIYLSVYSEIHTARTEDPADVDSSKGYYTADGEENDPRGFAKYVSDLNANAHARVWNGLRAARCWRSQAGDAGPLFLEKPGDEDNDVRWKAARKQLDQAALHGVSLIVNDRLQKFSTEANGDIKAAHWTFIQTLGAVLLRAMDILNKPEADKLRTELSKTDIAMVDASLASEAIAHVYVCP